jgi:hypothetical protein
MPLLLLLLLLLLWWARIRSGGRLSGEENSTRLVLKVRGLVEAWGVVLGKSRLLLRDILTIARIMLAWVLLLRKECSVRLMEVLYLILVLSIAVLVVAHLGQVLNVVKELVSLCEKGKLMWMLRSRQIGLRGRIGAAAGYRHGSRWRWCDDDDAMTEARLCCSKVGCYTWLARAPEKMKQFGTEFGRESRGRKHPVTIAGVVGSRQCNVQWWSR